jgi:FKBP12-rapamycin complex-associated protein
MYNEKNDFKNINNQENIKKLNNSRNEELYFKEIELYLINAINGFFKSISLSTDISSSQQDLLRLLTLWFKYGDISLIEKTLSNGINFISIDTWLLVIPQLIARVYTEKIGIKRLVQDLLSKIGKSHPQGLLNIKH